MTRHRLHQLAAAALTVAAAFVFSVVPTQAAAQKPNILVIIWGDDIGRDNISAYSLGIMGYKTPNIDRIAREGALFTDAYVWCGAGPNSAPYP